MSSEQTNNINGTDPKPTKTTPYSTPNQNQQHMKLWGILIFGVIGATATTFAIGQLRRSVDWFHSQAAFKGGSGGGYSRTGVKDEARRRYARRLREELEEEMERVERIRRMQSVFNREKIKHRRGYERWRDDSYWEYHQHFQRDDWYWKTDSSYGNWSNYKGTTHTPANYSLSHHYAVLGLARSRTTPYTDDEIKNAFRSKAKQYHPDQNQENKEVAEARFKEIMTSYEAIKSERKNNII
ncbi:putative DnaJ domain, Chaperone J-domain superfamily [Helianthus anomalus]